MTRPTFHAALSFVLAVSTAALSTTAQAPPTHELSALSSWSPGHFVHVGISTSDKATFDRCTLFASLGTAAVPQVIRGQTVVVDLATATTLPVTPQTGSAPGAAPSSTRHRWTLEMQLPPQLPAGLPIALQALLTSSSQPNAFAITPGRVYTTTAPSTGEWRYAARWFGGVLSLHRVNVDTHTVQPNWLTNVPPHYVPGDGCTWGSPPIWSPDRRYVVLPTRSVVPGGQGIVRGGDVHVLDLQAPGGPSLQVIPSTTPQGGMFRFRPGGPPHEVWTVSRLATGPLVEAWDLTTMTLVHSAPVPVASVDWNFVFDASGTKLVVRQPAPNISSSSRLHVLDLTFGPAGLVLTPTLSYASTTYPQNAGRGFVATDTDDVLAGSWFSAHSVTTNSQTAPAYAGLLRRASANRSYLVVEPFGGTNPGARIDLVSLAAPRTVNDEIHVLQSVATPTLTLFPGGRLHCMPVHGDEMLLQHVANGNLIHRLGRDPAGVMDLVDTIPADARVGGQSTVIAGFDLRSTPISQNDVHFRDVALESRDAQLVGMYTGSNGGFCLIHTPTMTHAWTGFWNPSRPEQAQFHF